MQVQPYLFFNGQCEAAVNFYQRALGAQLKALTRYKDSPEATRRPGIDDKVLHADLRIGDTTVLASDGDAHGETDFRGFSLSLAAKRDADANRMFAALADGGRVQVPIGPTPFASRFGMVADRFGVLWTVWVPASVQ